MKVRLFESDAELKAYWLGYEDCFEKWPLTLAVLEQLRHYWDYFTDKDYRDINKV